MCGGVAAMTTAAGRHFNRGQRAFFFALGYLGWFVSPWCFIVTTAAVLIVMAMRQFHSDGRSAVAADLDRMRPDAAVRRWSDGAACLTLRRIGRKRLT